MNGQSPIHYDTTSHVRSFAVYSYVLSHYNILLDG